MNETESKQIENVNLSIKPIGLFFIREALLKLVKISINERNPDNELILLYKCEESLAVIEEIDLVISQLSPNDEVFCDFLKS